MKGHVRARHRILVRDCFKDGRDLGSRRGSKVSFVYRVANTHVRDIRSGDICEGFGFVVASVNERFLRCSGADVCSTLLEVRCRTLRSKVLDRNFNSG